MLFLREYDIRLLTFAGYFFYETVRTLCCVYCFSVKVFVACIYKYLLLMMRLQKLRKSCSPKTPRTGSTQRTYRNGVARR